MGAMLETNHNIANIKRSSAINFSAEVFFDQLQFILGKELMDNLIVHSYGMNSRVRSKDVLDVSTEYISTTDNYKEFVVLHLARNSIYHQLPEILFYPLTISTPSMSGREIAEEIRKNRKKELANINFFTPFDTGFFKERVKVLNRHLNLFSDEKARQNLVDIARQIVGSDLPISEHEMHKLFLKLCNAESLKENIPELESLIKTVLELDVKIKYIPHFIKEEVFECLGEGQLGVTLGLNGEFRSELDDIEVAIMFAGKISNYNYLKQSIEIIRSILHFFVLSGRNIRVSYTVPTNTDLSLGFNYLGFDTNL